MITNKKIYCELSFLEELMKKAPSTSPSCIAFNEPYFLGSVNWFNVLKMLSASNLVLNISIFNYKILIEKNDNLGNFLKYRKKKSPKMSLDEAGFPDLSSGIFYKDEQKYAIYLTSLDKEKCLEVTRKYHIIVMNIDMILSSKYAFIDNGIALPSSTITNWDLILLPMNEMAPYLNTCNSILIADNYILKKSDEAIENNLKDLINNLFLYNEDERNTFYKDVSVCIFTLTHDDNDDWSSQIDPFISNIKNIRPDLDMKVTLYKVSNREFHDRALVTNCVWLDSGRGFDENLFSLTHAGNQNKSTKISILFPFIQTATRWCNSRYINFMKDVVRIVKKAVVPSQDYWGDIKSSNKLINYYLACNNDNAPISSVSTINVNNTINAAVNIIAS